MRLRHRDGVKLPLRQRPRESQANADTQLERERERGGSLTYRERAVRERSREKTIV